MYNYEAYMFPHLCAVSPDFLMTILLCQLCTETDRAERTVAAPIVPRKVKAIIDSYLILHFLCTDYPTNSA